MAMAGFSLNNLTLFGLVLAIGIVVDDAIVVVEAVEHHIEYGMHPKEATRTAMYQVSGPVIAVGLGAGSGGIHPCAFISGITGQFFRQFALTIAVSTLISAFNSTDSSVGNGTYRFVAAAARQDDRAAFALRLAYALGFGWAGFEYLTLYVSKLSMVPHEPRLARSNYCSNPRSCCRLDREQATQFCPGLDLPRIQPLVRLVNPALRGLGWQVVAGQFCTCFWSTAWLLYLTYLGFVKTPKGFIPTQGQGLSAR